MQQSRQYNDLIENLTNVLGAAMLCGAAAVLVAALSTVYQVVYTPESVAAVGMVQDFLAAQAPLLVADIHDSRSTFEIDPSARLVIVVLVGVFVVSALSSLMRGLVSSGLKLLKFKMPDEDTADT